MARLARRGGWFLISGGLGFAVDIIVLRLGMSFGLSPLLARIPALALAMATTWLVNRAKTFHSSGKPVGVEAGQYAIVAIAAALLNYCIYAILVRSFPQLMPELATAIAVGSTMIFSFTGYSRFVFRTTNRV